MRKLLSLLVLPLLVLGCSAGEEAAVPVDPKLKELEAQGKTGIPEEGRKAMNSPPASADSRSKAGG